MVRVKDCIIIGRSANPINGGIDLGKRRTWKKGKGSRTSGKGIEGEGEGNRQRKRKRLKRHGDGPCYTVFCSLHRCTAGQFVKR